MHAFSKRSWFVTLLFSIALASGTNCAFAAGHGGGGGGKGGGGGGKVKAPSNGEEPERQMSWQDSYDVSLEFASHGPRPVMVLIARENNEQDLKYLDQLASWPVIEDMSKKDVAFLWQTETAPRGKELIAQFNIKSFPYVVWLDQYGNALFAQTFPSSAAEIQSVIQGWKSTLENVNKFIRDRVARGDKLLLKGKLREAYQEYTLVAPFNGPDPEKARAGKLKCVEAWKKLASIAADMPTTAKDRAMILKGLTKETQGLDCSKLIADEVAAASKPKAAAPAAAPAATAPAAPVEVAASTPPPAPAAQAPVAPAPPAAPTPVVEIKALKSLASAPVRTERDSDESNMDMRSLSESSDERLKSAGKMLQEGLSAYRQACADSMDRGEARNALLRKAHDAFDKCVQTIDEVNAAKPSPQLDSVMSQISMLMYGCLKYHSL